MDPSFNFSSSSLLHVLIAVAKQPEAGIARRGWSYNYSFRFHYFNFKLGPTYLSLLIFTTPPRFSQSLLRNNRHTHISACHTCSALHCTAHSHTDTPHSHKLRQHHNPTNKNTSLPTLTLTQKQSMKLFTLSTILLFATLLALADGGSIGVNYGRIANNLPSAVKVVQLLKSQGLTRVKVYDSDPAVLHALFGSQIKVTVDLPNQQLFAAARAPSFALSWVERNVVAYHPHTQIEAIAVGNEVFVDQQNTTKFLIPAMENIYKALLKHNLHNDIKISSPIALSALANSYPSSSGSFRPELVEPVFKPMLDFLRLTGSYLMVNVYPFFAYESNADVIPLDYALFRDNPGVVDPGNGLRYLNLFDAQIDAVFAALDALKYNDVRIVVTETGWPSKGDNNEVGASVENAAAYNGNLVRKILTHGGTPMRPKADITVYLFALFNEDQKFGPTSERNFGLFYPDETKVYDIPFTTEGLKNYRDHPSPPASGGGQRQAAPAPTVSGGGGGISRSTTGNTWCVANPDADKNKLQAALDFACGEGGADCRTIQPGSTCYDPNTLVAHASFAFNSYYQKKARAGGSCYFGGTSYVVTQQPRYGNCEFPTGY